MACMYHFMISYVNNHDRKIFNDNSIHRIAIIYSKRALENIENRAIDDSSVDGEHGDLIPYLMSKISLSLYQKNKSSMSSVNLYLPELMRYVFSQLLIFEFELYSVVYMCVYFDKPIKIKSIAIQSNHHFDIFSVKKSLKIPKG